MAEPTSVWGIDIGQVALKALKVSNLTGELQVEAFEVIEHEKILSEPEADRNQLIRQSLETFLSRHSLAKSLVAVSVSGQTGFTRFVKLPPVDTKKIPDIVRYEAEQQIPFPIAEVNWQWQAFPDPNSPDVEVGIFAMKRTDVMGVLDHLSNAGLKVDIVQMAPLALCNYMSYDKQLAEEGATLLVDVGADKTDLVVSDGSRIWTRTIQIGGNNFTEALVKAFKLSFPKAERLKRTAATSKYARQIFQAMRPVFADLVQEVQRSIGYYTSLHRETRFRRLVGLGNGFRLPGLQKFLEQNLNVPVVRVDTYNRLTLGGGVSAPTFQENILSLAVAYGLAIQALEEPRVGTNLLPEEISRKRMWNRKRPWFAAAAVLIAGMFALQTYRAFADRKVLTEDPANYVKAAQITSELNRLQEESYKLGNQGNAEREQCDTYVKLLGYRDYWPAVRSVLSRAITSVAPDQRYLMDYAKAYTPQARKDLLKALHAIPRKDRKLITVMDLNVRYLEDVDRAGEEEAPPAPTAVGLLGEPGEPPQAGKAKSKAAGPGGKEIRRGFRIDLTARTPLSRERINQEIIAELRRVTENLLPDKSKNIPGTFPSVGFYQFESAQNPKFYKDVAPAAGGRGVARTFAPRPAGETSGGEEPAEGPALGDPWFPTEEAEYRNEDMSEDTVFYVYWVLTIDGDGVPKLHEPMAEE